MATRTNNEEQIFIGINDEVIELTGIEKENFIAQRQIDIAESAARQAAAEAKATARASALAKLAALGLTEEEIAAL